MSIWISLYQIINYEKLILKTFINRVIMKTQVVYKLRHKHINIKIEILFVYFLIAFITSSFA